MTYGQVEYTTLLGPFKYLWNQLWLNYDIRSNFKELVSTIDSAIQHILCRLCSILKCLCPLLRWISIQVNSLIWSHSSTLLIFWYVIFLDSVGEIRVDQRITQVLYSEFKWLYKSRCKVFSVRIVPSMISVMEFYWSY